MKSLLIVLFAISPIYITSSNAVVLYASFEDRYIGNEGWPSGSQNGLEAYLAYTPYYYLNYTYTNTYIDLGSNGKIQMHQPPDDPDQSIAFGYTLYSSGTGATWIVNQSIKSFGSFFQYNPTFGDGVFQISYINSMTSEIVANDTVNIESTKNSWFEYTYSSEKSFDRVQINNDETIFFDNVTFNTVPEPSAVLLLAVGLGGLALVRQGRKKD